MDTTKISPKYQVVIPRKVREAMGLKPGPRLQVVPFGDRIELIPLRSAKSLRGSLPGLDTWVPREADRLQSSVSVVNPSFCWCDPCRRATLTGSSTTINLLLNAIPVRTL